MKSLYFDQVYDIQIRFRIYYKQDCVDLKRVKLGDQPRGKNQDHIH